MLPEGWKKFFIDEQLKRDQLKLTRKLRSLRHLGSTKVQIGSHEFLNFSSNDYLGLTGDIRIAEAASSAAGRFGWGAAASRLVTGSSTLHHKLEAEAAAFRGTQTALVYGSGYQANLGVVSALVGEGDTVFSDEMNHASIVAGCRLSGAAVKVFKHLDYDDLERQLNGIKKGKILVVTDSLFSIEGDVADLNRIVKLCDKFKALLVVDDAHATGCLGKKGRGLTEMQGVTAQVSIVVANFSKALGSYGGFVACDEAVRDFLINHSRPFMYTTAIPVAVAAANLEALKIVRNEGDHLRQRLATNTMMARDKLESAGFDLTGNYQVIGIRVGSPDEAVFMAGEVEFHGLLVAAMRWPTVPQGRDCLRVSITAAHSEEDIIRLVEALKKARGALVKKRTDGLTRRANKRPSEQVTPPTAEKPAEKPGEPPSEKPPAPNEVTDFITGPPSSAGDTLIMQPRPATPEAPTTVVNKADEPPKAESAPGQPARTEEKPAEKAEDRPAEKQEDKPSEEPKGEVSGGEPVDDDYEDEEIDTDLPNDDEDDEPVKGSGSTLAPEQGAEIDDPVIANIEGRTRKRKRKTAIRPKEP